jgi:hypothetical protein
MGCSSDSRAFPKNPHVYESKTINMCKATTVPFQTSVGKPSSNLSTSRTNNPSARGVTQECDGAQPSPGGVEPRCIMEFTTFPKGFYRTTKRGTPTSPLHIQTIYLQGVLRKSATAHGRRLEALDLVASSTSPPSPRVFIEPHREELQPLHFTYKQSICKGCYARVRRRTAVAWRRWSSLHLRLHYLPQGFLWNHKERNTTYVFHSSPNMLQ